MLCYSLGSPEVPKVFIRKEFLVSSENNHQPLVYFSHAKVYFVRLKGLRLNFNSGMSNSIVEFLMSRMVNMGIFFILYQNLKVIYRVTSMIQSFSLIIAFKNTLNNCGII